MCKAQVGDRATEFPNSAEWFDRNLRTDRFGDGRVVERWCTDTAVAIQKDVGEQRVRACRPQSQQS